MADTRLKDRIAVVTGGNGGIGRAIVNRFVLSGARVVIADLKSAGLEDEINEKFGPNTATFIQTDTTQEESVANLVTEAAKWSGIDRVDIMCNFAGIGPVPEGGTGVHDRSMANFDRMFAINTRGVYMCSKYAISQFLKQEPLPANKRGDQNRGWIVNAASAFGLVGMGGTVPYCTTKFAVVGLTKALALEYASRKIHINCVCPGFVDTPFISYVTADQGMTKWASSLHPWGDLGRPEDVADATLFLCSDEAGWITGHAMSIDGGFVAQ